MQVEISLDAGCERLLDHKAAIPQEMVLVCSHWVLWTGKCALDCLGNFKEDRIFKMNCQNNSL